LVPLSNSSECSSKQRLMKIEILLGDITTIATEAIVNAANSSLLGGGGVDGAIHRKGGRVILEECIAIRDKQGGCPTGEAVITSAGNLPARWVIHTVGPVWAGGNSNEPGLLANCYRNSLALAVSHQVKSIAFPNISTGVYGFPKERAAAIALETILNFDRLQGLERIVCVCFDEENFRIYNRLYQPAN
jgi:O-acetyl-ADP-ribose deacetylase (regulator of RNase III)